MLVPMKAILDAADKNGYAQGAFNVNAVCQVKAAVETHEILRSPAIIQGADLANGFMGGRIDFAGSTLEDKRLGAKNIGAAVKKYAENSDIPVALHLDHGKNFDSCVAAIDGGYTSVMIDGSSLPFDENVELTREVVKYAHERGITVEGELGVLAGVEKKDILFIISNGLHPRSKESDAKAIFGEELFNEFWHSGQIISHDSEDEEHMVYLGTTKRGDPVYMSKYVYDVQAQRDRHH